MMKTLSFAILLAACVDNTSTPETTVHHQYAFVAPANAARAVTDPSLADHRLDAAGSLLAADSESVPDEICNVLPADGSCDGVCDPVGFAASLPKGSCADAVCTLTDGRVIRYGGCN